MVNSVVRLPDGQTFTVVPVFAGLLFKSNDLNTHHSPFPVGWTVVLHTEDGKEAKEKAQGSGSEKKEHTPHVHSFRKPTLQHDSMFISSISNPSSSDFKPAASPTRQIAMMLWVTLYWYFQQPAPEPTLPMTEASRSTPLAGRPRGAWRIHIKRDGVLRGRNLVPKLERMGLIATLDSAVGVYEGSSATADSQGWDAMFVEQGMFWQIPAQLFLFTLQPVAKGGGSGGSSGGSSSAGTTFLHGGGNSSFPGSPTASRPGSPVLDVPARTSAVLDATAVSEALTAGTDASSSSENTANPAITTVQSFPIGPFFSTSHLPTYYPPSPLRYTMTGAVRHPARPKPPRMGEVFYTRFVPSVGQYLSFRVASASPRPVPYFGPRASVPTVPTVSASASTSTSASAPASASVPSSTSPPHPCPPARSTQLASLSDKELLETWFSSKRVQAFWGTYDPQFLATSLSSRHSFPVIGLWDGVPFGYFEVYWVKEDVLGQHAAGVGCVVDDFDRGLHVFVGEEWARGRVQLWLTSLVHWMFGADYRTMSVCIEPRVDNARFIQHLQFAGFCKQKEVTFPHKQSWFGRLHRDGWTAPAL